MSDPAAATDIQRWTLIVTAGNALASAIVAIVVTRLAHKFTDTREQRKERAAADDRRDDRIQQRIEGLVDALLEHSDVQQRHGMFVASFGIAHALGGDIPEERELAGVPPIDRALTIVRLYFPEWHEAMASVTQANAALSTFWSNEINSIATDAHNWDAAERPTYVERHSVLHKALMDATDNVAGLARARVQMLHAPRADVDESRPSLWARLWGKFKNPAGTGAST
jgi:hypothetical protein